MIQYRDYTIQECDDPWPLKFGYKYEYYLDEHLFFAKTIEEAKDEIDERWAEWEGKEGSFMKTAIINRTGKRLYTSNNYDPENISHGWFSHPDGNSPDCQFVMDNREFYERLSKGEITLLERST